MSNSLASVHPELISEWSEKNLPLTPDKITFGSNKRVWWIGACGHEWETSVKARSKGEKCPICSGARVIEGINDIPLWHKPNLSIEEAVAYSGIGRDKLYELTNPEDCPFVLWIGNRRMIKRKKFDEYIERQYSI